jgi:hypothetical protein
MIDAVLMLYSFYIETTCNGFVKLSKKSHAYSAKRSESKKIEKSKRRKRNIPRF